MRILLRFVAVYTAAAVVATIVLILGMWHRGGIPYLLHAGAFGILTIAGWVATLTLGPPASVLLWQRQNSGRILAAVYWAMVCAYYLGPAIFWPNGRISLPMTGSGLLSIFLLLPASRRACHEQLTAKQPLTEN